MDEKKQEMLVEIEALMRYGEEQDVIEPSLLKYLDLDSLKHIVETLKKRRKNRIEEEKEWLAQFRKEK